MQANSHIARVEFHPVLRLYWCRLSIPESVLQNLALKQVHQDRLPILEERVKSLYSPSVKK